MMGGLLAEEKVYFPKTYNNITYVERILFKYNNRIHTINIRFSSDAPWHYLTVGKMIWYTQHIYDIKENKGIEYACPFSIIIVVCNTYTHTYIPQLIYFRYIYCDVCMCVLE